MLPSTIARLEAAAAEGQDLQLSCDPAFASLAPRTTKCLALAAGSGHLSIVQLLLKHPAYLSPSGGFPWLTAAWFDLDIALVEAARNGHLEVARALLTVLTVPTEANRCIAGDMTNGEALDAAAAGGHNDVVQLICNAITQQDAARMRSRPVSWIFLAWDRKYAAQERWSSFAWYCRIRPRFVLCILALEAINWAWIMFARGHHPLFIAFWALVTLVHWVM